MRDIARKAGVGTATVDRVLNGRAPVRQRTAERVLAAADELNYHARRVIHRRVEAMSPQATLGFILQKEGKWFYRALAASIRSAAGAVAKLRASVEIRFVESLSPTVLADALLGMAERSDAVAMVSVDHPRISEAIAKCTDASVPVLAMLSQLDSPHIAGFVGVDGRKAGRTAGWFMTRAAGSRPEVGLLVGSHRYLGHEAQELGFRGYMREFAPDTRLHDSPIILDDAEVAYEATTELLTLNPGITGLYHCGGGATGVISALRELDRARSTFYICHGRSPATKQALLDGVVDVTIASPVDAIAQRVVETMVLHLTGKGHEMSRTPLDFQLITAENL